MVTPCGTPNEHSARVAALRDLIQFRRPVAEAIQQLAEFPWDCPAELVELKAADVIGAIGMHLRGSLSGDVLESWAEALTGRDDIGMAAGQASIVADALFELSSPELFGAPATTLAPLLERLRRA